MKELKEELDLSIDYLYPSHCFELECEIDNKCSRDLRNKIGKIFDNVNIGLEIHNKLKHKLVNPIDVFFNETQNACVIEDIRKAYPLNEKERI